MSFGEGFELIEVAPNGAIVKRKQFHKGEDNSIDAVDVNAAGEILLAGVWKNEARGEDIVWEYGSKRPESTPEIRKNYIAKLSPDYKIKWEQKFTTVGGGAISSAKFLRNGDVLIDGSTGINNDNFLQKLSGKNGKSIWKKKPYRLV